MTAWCQSSPLPFRATSPAAPSHHPTVGPAPLQPALLRDWPRDSFAATKQSNQVAPTNAGHDPLAWVKCRSWRLSTVTGSEVKRLSSRSHWPFPREPKSPSALSHPAPRPVGAHLFGCAHRGVRFQWIHLFSPYLQRPHSRASGNGSLGCRSRDLSVRLADSDIRCDFRACSGFATTELHGLPW